MRNIFNCVSNNGKVIINGTTYTGSVCIDDNNVVYCNGKDTGNNVGRNITISKDATPVMGSEETFMEKYFGGVGYMPIQPTKENNGL